MNGYSDDSTTLYDEEDEDDDDEYNVGDGGAEDEDEDEDGIVAGKQLFLSSIVCTGSERKMKPNASDVYSGSRMNDDTTMIEAMRRTRTRGQG